MSCFLSTVNTVCNPDFILSYLESGVLWSINVWEPDSTTFFSGVPEPCVEEQCVEGGREGSAEGSAEWSVL